MKIDLKCPECGRLLNLDGYDVSCVKNCNYIPDDLIEFYIYAHPDQQID